MSTPALSDAIEEFLLARRADGLAGATLSWYASMLRQFSEHAGAVRLDEVNRSHLRRYIVALRESDYAPDSVYAHIKALHAFWRWSADEFGITNPMSHIAYPKQPAVRAPRRAQDEDILRMLAVCGDDPQGLRDKAIIGFLTDTGCRAGGLVGLTVSDLDIEHRRAYVTEKGGKQRTVFYSEATAGMLSQWLAAHDSRMETVFYNLNKRRPLTTNGLLQLLRRLGKTAGVSGPVNPHAFRHRFGIQFMLAGGDSGVLQQIMGHSDVETTINRYGRFDDSQLAAAHRKVKPLFKKGKIE